MFVVYSRSIFLLSWGLTLQSIFSYDFRMFTGYAEVSDYIKKIIELSESVGVENHETSFYYMAGYDSPFQPFDRHNEAWLVAKN